MVNSFVGRFTLLCSRYSGRPSKYCSQVQCNVTFIRTAVTSISLRLSALIIRLNQSFCRLCTF